MKIITNNIPRNLKYGYEMPEKLRSDFDYLDDLDSSEFFVYRGQWYDIGEFMRVPEELKPWHGYAADSYFSGTLIKLVDDQIIVGRYYC